MKKQTYDPNKDYQAEINKAAYEGNWALAAQLEQERNQKIQGEGLDVLQTNKFARYLPSVHQQQMDDILDRISSREPFTYDMNADALFQQYRQQFGQSGRLAMEDTMGQAAALTGGYGNSYAQSVGQQAYNAHLDGLNDVLPELYTLARQRYADEGEALLDRYALLADRESALRAQHDAEEDKAYSLAMTMLQSGIMPSADMLAGAGIAGKDAQAIYQQVQTELARRNSSTSGGTRSGTAGSSAASAGKALKDTMMEKIFYAYINGNSAELEQLTALYRSQGYDVDSYLDSLGVTEGLPMATPGLTYGSGLDAKAFDQLMHDIAAYSVSALQLNTLLSSETAAQLSKEQWEQIIALFAR